MKERLLIIGATSAIATAVAHRYAARAARIALIARRADALQVLAADLRARGASEVGTWVLDANDIARHGAVLDGAWQRFEGFDHVLLAHGVLPDQAQCQAQVEAALAAFDTNARSVVALLTDLSNRFERQACGAIAIISSPAGDRGRAGNYLYGAAKAAVTTIASGLRHRLAAKGVRVLSILPGYVDTPLTAAFPKGALWARPDRVAKDIDRALARGFGVIYTPWFWRWIMLLIKHLPERVFVRLKV